MRNFRKIFAVVLCVVLLAAFSFSASAMVSYNEVHSLPEDLSGYSITGGPGDPGTSGAMISTTEDGYFVGIRIWVEAGRNATQSVSIYDVYDAPVLLAGPFTWTIDASQTGWHTYYFETPFEVSADGYYGIVVSNGNCAQGNDDCFMSAIHGLFDSYTVSDKFDRVFRGFSWDKDVCPSNWNGDGTYLVDVCFVTDEDYEAAQHPATNEPETNEPATNEPAENVQTGDLNISVLLAVVACMGLAVTVLARVKKNVQ